MIYLQEEKVFRGESYDEETKECFYEKSIEGQATSILFPCTIRRVDGYLFITSFGQGGNSL